MSIFLLLFKGFPFFVILDLYMYESLCVSAYTHVQFRCMGSLLQYAAVWVHVFVREKDM